MSQWQPVGIELPPGWKDGVAEVAKETGCPMRYVWMAAIDGLLSMDTSEIERRVIAYEMMARKDFESLAKTKPGRCADMVSDWAADFAKSMNQGMGPGPGVAGAPKRAAGGRRKRAKK
jgi:hypothetical protein